MTAVTLDIDSIGGALAGIVSGLIAIYAYLRSKGYIGIWMTKLFDVTAPIAEEAKKQDNEIALAKLQMPDDILCVLNSFEVNDSGQVVLKGQGRVNTLLKLERALTDSEKDEVIKIVRKVLVNCKK
jgi:hypothetical protein